MLPVRRLVSRSLYTYVGERIVFQRARETIRSTIPGSASGGTVSLRKAEQLELIT